MNEVSCTLCGCVNVHPPLNIHRRTYHHCTRCALIFMDKSDLPDKKSERDRYLLHQNNSNNQGYLHFLMKAVDPVMPYLGIDKKILDYGCGPDPVLSEMICNFGYLCEIYDPLFYPEWPKSTYDIIFATECFEHFFEPQAEIFNIRSLLSENGTLVVMTELWNDPEHFKSWYYVRDFTHVSFYHLKTMNYIEQNYGMKITYTDNQRLVVFRKD